MVYTIYRELGSGGFATVYQARSWSTGNLIAVKVMVKGERNWRNTKELAYRGEGEILPRLDHKHIIRSLFSYGWATNRVHIGLELMDGTLESLAESMAETSHVFIRCVLWQMLQALDYLAAFGLVHRDVKPENIFYTTTYSPQVSFTGIGALPLYHFRLGDFGLCDEEHSVDEHHGTRPFMAPEVLSYRAKQSHKSDMWALYVTLLWLLDLRGFRNDLRNAGYVDGLWFAHESVAPLARHPWVSTYRSMGRFDPTRRPTARDVLENLFGGEGVTPRGEDGNNRVGRVLISEVDD